jgi:hypothetical protein
MAEANAVTPPLQTAAATLEKAKLRKVLSRIDLVLFTACAILGFDTWPPPTSDPSVFVNTEKRGTAASIGLPVRADMNPCAVASLGYRQVAMATLTFRMTELLWGQSFASGLNALDDLGFRYSAVAN